MPVSMLVKCEKCGYENFPQHRYCGMCGAELRIPGVPGPRPAAPSARLPEVAGTLPKEAAPAPKEKEAAAQQVSGPSFLGLGDETAQNKSFSYLLEDDTPSHRGRNVILVLLIAAVAAAAWYWRQDLRVLASRFLNTPPPATKANNSDNAEPNSPAPGTSGSTGAAVPANNASAGTQAEQPGSGANPQTPATQSPPPATPAGASPATEATQSAPAGPPQPSNPAPAADAASTATPKPDESEEATSPPPRPHKSEMTRAQRAAASASQAEDLEAQGEKYLYGNGVPENCTRARTNLLAAAQHSNAQAQSVLGTMYATGHCATRDLPTAYRWFGRSLRQDPKNSRLEEDLRVLWNQMTPAERQQALRDER
jgi:hypothetical protein